MSLVKKKYVGLMIEMQMNYQTQLFNQYAILVLANDLFMTKVTRLFHP